MSCLSFPYHEEVHGDISHWPPAGRFAYCVYSHLVTLKLINLLGNGVGSLLTTSEALIR